MLISKAVTSFFIIAILILVSFSTVITENKGSDIVLNEEFQDIEADNITLQEEMREVTFSTEENEKSGNLNFKFTFKANTALSITLSSGRNGALGWEDNKIGLDFIAIIEYLDTDSDGRFDVQNDQVASLYPLSNTYYFNNIIQNIKTVDDIPLQDITNEYFHEILYQKYQSGYEQGFKTAYKLGLVEGRYDRENNLTYNSRYDWHIPRKDYYKIRGDIIDSINPENKDDFSYTGFSYDEMIARTGNGYDYGFGNGFKEGYSEGYNLSQPLQGSNGYWDYYFNIYEKPEYWLPRFEPIEVEDSTDDDDHREIEVTITSIKGNFKLNFKMSDHFQEASNGYFSPFSTKINMNINNYPFGSENTDLALLCDIYATTKSKQNITFNRLSDSFDEIQGLASDEEELRIESLNYSGFFSWVEYAQCRNFNHDVKITLIPHYTSIRDYSTASNVYVSQTSQNHLIISYPRCDDINHDPKMGFTRVNNEYLYKLPEEIRETPVDTDLNGLVFILSIIGAVSFVIISRKNSRKD